MARTNRIPNPNVVALGVCADCGVVHQYCTAHRSRRDEDGNLVACAKNARPGLLVCTTHGGSTPAARAKVARHHEAVKTEAIVKRALGAKRAVPVADAEASLEHLAGEVWAFKDAAAAIVANLTPDQIVTETANGPKLNPLVELLERSQTHAAKILTDMVRHGFTERRVLVEEAQHAVLNTALRAVLERHGVDAALVLPDLAAELRSLDAIDTGGRALDAGGRAIGAGDDEGDDEL